MKKGILLLGLTTFILTGCGKVDSITCTEVVTLDGESYTHEITASMNEKNVSKIDIIYTPVSDDIKQGEEYNDKISDIKLKYGSKFSDTSNTSIKVENVDKLENGTKIVGLSSTKFMHEVKFENPKIKCKTKTEKGDK